MLKNVKRKQKTAAMLETIASVANLGDTSSMTVLIGQREEKAFAVREYSSSSLQSTQHILFCFFVVFFQTKFCRRVLHNNEHSCNLIGPYCILVISLRNLTWFTIRPCVFRVGRRM